MDKWPILTKAQVESANSLKLFEHESYIKFRLILANFNEDLDHQLDVWAPDAKGKFPVILNLSGMGGIFPGDMYNNMFTQ